MVIIDALLTHPLSIKQFAFGVLMDIDFKLLSIGLGLHLIESY
jgi:hypothetical protein